ncbi:ead/Ea22-like family protein [Salmonella enterica]|nr:ead/Ea22-like family protein [Salmonella enterica]EAA9597703.1 ead/Ea22-like family protein [Salmonella enterica]EAO9640131.1 ead/Ea22-like family protein [Salmonella enterica]EKI3326436.1 ead/Ea22-like family protein [Salmonella enterica]
MSNIDKQALRETAEKALPAMQRLLMMPNDELFDEAALNVDGDVDAANAFNLLAGPETMLALLDECAALAAENAALMAAKEIIRHLNVNREEANFCGIDDCYIDDAVAAMITPATDAFLAEVRSQARNEGINYAASRLAAAFNNGFIDKPVSEVLDVTRMILSAKEDLANDPLPAADGLSGEYAEKSIEEWAAQLRKGASL